MSEYIPVPVDVAKSISKTFQKSAVIILAYDASHNLTHTTTYGVDAFFKENAAAIGRICANAIGCDISKTQDFEDFHKDYDPARFKEAVELLQKIYTRNDGSPAAIAMVEKFLKQLNLTPRRA